MERIYTLLSFRRRNIDYTKEPFVPYWTFNVCFKFCGLQVFWNKHWHYELQLLFIYFSFHKQDVKPHLSGGFYRLGIHQDFIKSIHLNIPFISLDYDRRWGQFNINLYNYWNTSRKHILINFKRKWSDTNSHIGVVNWKNGQIVKQ